MAEMAILGSFGSILGSFGSILGFFGLIWIYRDYSAVISV